MKLVLSLLAMMMVAAAAPAAVDADADLTVLNGQYNCVAPGTTKRSSMVIDVNRNNWIAINGAELGIGTITGHAVRRDNVALDQKAKFFLFLDHPITLEAVFATAGRPAVTLSVGGAFGTLGCAKI